jgi:hypothetical protein
MLPEEIDDEDTDLGGVKVAETFLLPLGCDCGIGRKTFFSSKHLIWSWEKILGAH